MANRLACFAGSFYPDNPQILRSTVEAWLHTEPSAPLTEPLVTLLPHAGHVYCGHVIGATLARVRLPETLILLCPNHTGQGHPLAVWSEGAWQTPLGSVKVDTDAAAALLALGCGFAADTAAHAREHSLEVLLPFLQCHSPHSRIVPVSVALGDSTRLRTVGTALGHLLATRRSQGHPAGIIVSSDMNHFESQSITIHKDKLALSAILQLQPEKLLQNAIEHNISMCGVLPTVIAIHAALAQKSCTAELVQHTTSAELTKDIHKVVGYCGLLVK